MWQCGWRKGRTWKGQEDASTEFGSELKGVKAQLSSLDFSQLIRSTLMRK